MILKPKSLKKRSQKQEKSVAKNFKARVTVASGALWGMKADVRSDKFLIECKTTEKDYYPLSARVWEKIEREAIRDRGRIPLMVIDLNDKDRMVVFKSSDFTTKLPLPYECSINGNHKSYRISLKELVDYEKDSGSYTYGKLFVIAGDKRNMLFFMRHKDFEEIFKEEIQ